MMMMTTTLTDGGREGERDFLGYEFQLNGSTHTHTERDIYI